MKTIIGKYINGNYNVLLMEDGSKIRYSNDDYFKPKFAESIDCCITKKCSINCSFCYESCTSKGSHAKLMIDENTPAQNWITSLHKYTELAINGNDLDHPELEWFLMYLKKQNVFANITVNQLQFLNNYHKLLDWSNRDLFKGLGISLNKVDDDFLNKIKTIPNIVIHVIAGIVTENDLISLADKNIKLLILGYKDIGRGKTFKTEIVYNNINILRNNIENVINKFHVTSFDNLAIDQLHIRELFNKDKLWDEFYSGDDGEFTFYIDAVNRTYSKNSIEQNRFDIGDLTVDDMFNKI